MEERISVAQYWDMVEKKQSKMRNVKTVVDGIMFDSKKEADYYCKLKILKQQEMIIDFLMQVSFLVHEGYYKNGEWIKPIYYKADFVVESWDLSVEDEIAVKHQVHEVKGRWTRTAIDKRKMFEKRYPEYEFIVI